MNPWTGRDALGPGDVAWSGREPLDRGRPALARREAPSLHEVDFRRETLVLCPSVPRHQGGNIVRLTPGQPDRIRQTHA